MKCWRCKKQRETPHTISFNNGAKQFCVDCYQLVWWAASDGLDVNTGGPPWEYVMRKLHMRPLDEQPPGLKVDRDLPEMT